MNASEFERYLSLLSGLLKLSRRQRDSIAQELRDHLEERLTELRAAGVSEEDAVREALEEFGDVASLAQDFAGAAGNQHRRTLMRITVGALSAVSAAALVVVTCWPTAPVIREVQAQAPVIEAKPETPPLLAAASDGDAETVEALRKLNTVVDFKATELPLKDAVAMLGKLAGVQMRIAARHLMDDGVDPGTPVTLKLEKVPARTVLGLLLEPLRLQYVLADGLVEVTSQVAADTRLDTRVYAGADLLANHQLGAQAVRGVTPGGGGFFAGGGNTGFITDGLPAAAVGRAGVCEVIKAVIDPQSWDEVGGRGTVQDFQGMLVVSQTERNHRDLVALLAELRRVSEQPPGKDAAPADPVSLALAKRVSLKIDGKSLADSISVLREQLGVEVLLDQKALEDEGLNDTLLLEMPTGEFPAHRALRLALGPSGLTFVNLDGCILRITTQVQAEERLTTALYNVRDLLTAPGVEPLDESDLDYDSIMDVVQATIAPQSWDSVGGRGSMSGFRGLLVVSQVAECHQGIAELLARLRSIRQKQKAPAAAAAADPEALELRGYGLAELQLALSWGAPVAEDGAAPANAVNALKDEELTKALLKMVQESVEPQSWKATGGRGHAYAIRDASGGAILLVRQTAAVHRQVRRFMRTLEQEVQRVQSRVGRGQ